MEFEQVLKDFAAGFEEIKCNTKVFTVPRDRFVEAVKKVVETFGRDKVFVSTYVAVDRPDQRVIELDIFLIVLGKREVLCIRTTLPREDPRIGSVVNMLPSALVGELEIHDLFGVVFEGNPYLRRPVFAPEEIAEKGVYPLRKDYRLGK